MMYRRLFAGLVTLLLVLLAPAYIAPFSSSQASGLAGHDAVTDAHTARHTDIAHATPALLGTWTNTDISTRDIVRIVLSPAGSTTVNVHAFGSCHPTLCDWGTVTGTVHARDVTSPDGVAFSATYSFGFAQDIVTGILENTAYGPYLNVQSFTTFTDGSGRSNYYSIERFAKVIEHIRYATGPRIPHPHVEGAGMTLGNRLFVITGSAGDCTDGQKGDVNRLVDIYNPSTNSFSSGAPVRIARDNNPIADVAATPFGQRGFLIGGTATCGGATVRTVEEYNPTTGLWTALPSSSDLPAGLDGAHHCGAALGSKIYDFQQSGIGVFNAISRTWNTLKAPVALAPSLFCRATVLNSDLIMLTGPGNGSADAHSQRILLFTPSTGTLTSAPTTTAAMAEHGMTYLPIYSQALVLGGDFSGEVTVQSIAASSIVTTATPLPMTWDDGASGVLYTTSGPHVYLAGGMGGGSNTPPVLIATPTF